MSDVPIGYLGMPSRSSPFDLIERLGYSDPIHDTTIARKASEMQMAGRGQRFHTTASFLAKRDGRCFRLILDFHYANHRTLTPVVNVRRDIPEVPGEEYESRRRAIQSPNWTPDY